MNNRCLKKRKKYMTTPLLLYLWVIFKSELILQFTLAFTVIKQATSFRCMLDKQLHLLTTAPEVYSEFCFFSTNTINAEMQNTEEWMTAYTDGTIKWTGLTNSKTKCYSINRKIPKTVNINNSWVAVFQYLTLPSNSGAQSQPSFEFTLVELAPFLQKAFAD